MKNFCYKYPHPAVTCDCVIFGFDGVQLKTLLIERGQEPYLGRWALPGGFMKIDETAEECTLRELQEETGLKNVEICQFNTYSAIDRDPRERVITISFFALVKLSDVIGGDDARSAKWYAFDQIPPLAFDHDRILRDALHKLKETIFFQPIGFGLLPDIFTMPELQNLYEAILEIKFDRRNFAKKMLKLGILDDAEKRDTSTPSRIPKKYTFNSEKYFQLKLKGFKLEF